MNVPELKKKLQGVMIPMITPFKENLELDEEGLRKNTMFLIEKGIADGSGALMPLGSTGEWFSLTGEERKIVTKIVVKEAKGKVPVIIGCAYISTQQAIEFCKYAEDKGADAVMVMPPYYGTPTDEMIIKFFSDISDNINIGIMIHNEQGVTGVDISIDTLLKIAEIENVVALKEISDSFFKFNLITIALKDKINVIDGSGEAYEPFSMMMGTKGFCASSGNIFPEFFLDMYKAVKEGNFEKALDLRIKFYPFLKLVYDKFSSASSFTNMIKESCNDRGLAGGPVRPPLLPINTNEDKRKMKIIVNQIIKYYVN